MLQELGDGVFRRRFKSLDLNIGVVIGDEGVLLVDSRASHRQAHALADELTKLTPLPVRWVVNTHFHWDHTFGNAVFDEAEIWGHERCREVLLAEGPQMRASARKWLPERLHPEIDEVEIVAPTETFAEHASISIGRDVVMTYHGLAHTDSDIVVRVPSAGVGFYGDMVEEGAPPNFGDAFPSVWPTTLASAIEDCPEVVVPGHGDVVDREFVVGQIAELEAVARIVDGDESVSAPYSDEVMDSVRARMERLGS